MDILKWTFLGVDVPKHAARNTITLINTRLTAFKDALSVVKLLHTGNAQLR